MKGAESGSADSNLRIDNPDGTCYNNLYSFINPSSLFIKEHSHEVDISE